MRRRLHEEPDNKERWLVSYADFITLLFAFFVVMYSISSVNEGKYKVLSETMEGAFNVVQRSILPVQVGDTRSTPAASTKEPINPLQGIPRGEEGDDTVTSEGMREIADQLHEEFRELIAEGEISVNENADWVELTLSSNILFTSGQAEPVGAALPMLEKIAAVLRNTDNAVMVEGFTDNVPIRTSRYPSNWELSVARASAVVRVLTFEGVDPSRLAAVGYGENQPIARNDTPEGRKRNRRVVLLISKNKEVRETLRDRD